jgi:beta-barrel assembly-enhancing protease
MHVRPVSTRVLACFLALHLVICSWAASAGNPQLPDPGSVRGFGKQEQEQLGLQAMAEVYKQMPVLPDSSPETQYIQQLGNRLVSVIPQQYSWPFQFHVIPQRDINAFALPGGPMFVNTGALLAAANEAELAGVMAHEMSHVYMQHSAKQASKQSMAQGILGVIGGVLGNGIGGSLARLGIGIGAGTFFLKYSRDDEAQADAVGAIIMYKAGYNPQAMADFFLKLEKQAGPGGPQFLSDHPNPGNRNQAIAREIRNWPPKKYLGTSAGFESAQKHAGTVKNYSAQEIADGAKQGVWLSQNRKNGSIPANLPMTASQGGAAVGGGTLENVSYPQIKPSGDYKRLDHSAFTISYPNNWQVSGDQNSSVTIAPSAGVTQGSVAYGVVIGGAQDQSGSLDQATQNLVQSLEQSNPGLRASGSEQRISVNGMEGREITLSGASPVESNGQALRERDWLVTVPRQQGGLLYLVFIAPENDFGQLRGTYQKMLDSLEMK